MKNLPLYLIPYIVYLFFSSCAVSEYSDFEKTETGLMYKFHSKGIDTVHPKYGEIVHVKMAKRLGDSIFESTNEFSPNGIPQYLQKPVFKGAIEEGIITMTIGDSATFLIHTDSINKHYPAPDSTKKFKPNSYLAFDVKLMNIQTIEDAKWEEDQRKKTYIMERKKAEPKELSRYVEDNHIDVKPTPSGLYLIAKEKGKGTSPKDGDSVVVHYTGSFLNGTIFDSSVKRDHPFGFTVGAKRVIEGWEQALKMMKKGAMVTIIMPSSLAYDSAGYMNRKTGEYFIPPFSPIKFDIQLLDINPKK